MDDYLAQGGLKMKIQVHEIIRKRGINTSEVEIRGAFVQITPFSKEFAPPLQIIEISNVKFFNLTTKNLIL